MIPVGPLLKEFPLHVCLLEVTSAGAFGFGAAFLEFFPFCTRDKSAKSKQKACTHTEQLPILTLLLWTGVDCAPEDTTHKELASPKPREEKSRFPPLPEAGDLTAGTGGIRVDWSQCGHLAALFTKTRATTPRP